MSESVDRVNAVVAGHICLDVIPTFGPRQESWQELFAPGRLVNVGPVVTATGGAVSNTGLALHRLGVKTELIGKIGTDMFGSAILDILRHYDEALTRRMITDASETTSYTIVISVPGIDRMFFHYTGANDGFGADDVPVESLAGGRIFHFGYPPAMRRMYLNEGRELVTLMQRVKAAGMTTSLDMAYPEPDSEAGRIDWASILARVLPYVDIILPSLEETLFMLDRPRFEAFIARGAPMEQVDGALLHDLAGRLLDMGAAMAVLKLGDQGLYVRTTSEAASLRLPGLPQVDDTWQSRELLAPCFKADVVGTTGAGDCTIAGFLAGLLKGLPIEDVMTGAVAVGGFNVESADAVSGIPHWDTVQARIGAGWERHEPTLSLDGWQWDAVKNIWVGPHDHA